METTLGKPRFLAACGHVQEPSCPGEKVCRTRRDSDRLERGEETGVKRNPSAPSASISDSSPGLHQKYTKLVVSKVAKADSKVIPSPVGWRNDRRERSLRPTSCEAFESTVIGPLDLLMRITVSASINAVGRNPQSDGISTMPFLKQQLQIITLKTYVIEGEYPRWRALPRLKYPLKGFTVAKS